MKKTVILFSIIILAAGIIGGIAVTATQNRQDKKSDDVWTNPEIIKSEDAITEEGAKSEIGRRVNAYLDAETERIENEGFPELNDGTITEDSAWYCDFKAFYIQIGMEYDMFTDAFEVMKRHGLLSSDFCIEMFADRGLFYDCIITFCDAYKDKDNSLTVTDRELLKWCFDRVYTSLETEFTDEETENPENKELVAKRDQAMTAIENTGHTISYNRGNNPS